MVSESQNWGGAQRGGSGSGSLIRLLTRCRLGWQTWEGWTRAGSCASKLIPVAADKSFIPYWLLAGTSAPHHVGFHRTACGMAVFYQSTQTNWNSVGEGCPRMAIPEAGSLEAAYPTIFSPSSTHTPCRTLHPSNDSFIP